MLLTALSALTCSTLSCRTAQTQTQIHSHLTDTLTICTTERDTIVVTQPDSATFWAWVQCDSLGNVLLQQLNEERGRHLDILTSLTAQGGTAQIRVTATAPPQPIVVPKASSTVVHSHATQKTQTQTRTLRPSFTVRLRSLLLTIAAVLLAFALGFLAGRGRGAA